MGDLMSCVWLQKPNEGYNAVQVWCIHSVNLLCHLW